MKVSVIIMKFTVLSVTIVLYCMGFANSTNAALMNTIKVLQEKVNKLLDNRQQDYLALEESLKTSIAKNTEVNVLRNEVKQLR